MAPRLLWVISAVIALSAASGPAAGRAAAGGAVLAAQDDAEAKRRAADLDALFARLKEARTEEEADPIVAGIWQAWAMSGDDDVDLLMRRAAGNMQVGRLDAAVAVLDDVVRRAPDFAEGWNRRATALYLLGEYDRSLADCERALTLEPRHFGALAGQGLIALAQQKWKAALDAFRKALAVNPFLKERHELIPALEKKVEGEPL